MPTTRITTAGSYRIELDLSQQVLGLDIPKEMPWSAGEERLSPTIERMGSGGFVSAAALALKAKQFDDGLYATVELAAQNGAGRYPGKVGMLTTLARWLADTSVSDGNALGVVFGACELGGLKTEVPAHAVTTVREVVESFLRDELRSKPISFYTWSPALEADCHQPRRK